MAANAETFREEPKTISAKDRLEALLLAQMNEEKAGLCSKEQGPLRAFFEMNSKFLARIAE